MSRRATIGVVAALLSAPAIARADVVTDWNNNALNIVKQPGQNPFTQSRIIAITQLAVFEAVNAINGDYEPYLGTVTAPAGASEDAAVIEAAYRVLLNYVGANNEAAGPGLILKGQRDASLAGIADGPSKDDGIALGAAAAAAMIANRAGDVPAPAFHVPEPAVPGEWQPTPSCVNPPISNRGALLHWQNVRPFAIESSSQFRLDDPPAITSNRYKKDYNEVKEVGQNTSTERPQDRSDVATFFNINGAPHVFNPAAQQTALAQGFTSSQYTRALALLNMAIADGLIASIESKYVYDFWRPETAIRNGDTDGNNKTVGDPTWTPFIVAPCFPSYGSAHAAASYGARKVLERIFGGGGHDITLTNATPAITLHYTKFKQITNDVDDARVYGGIHFRFDQEEGGRQGRHVGSYVIKNFLKRVDGGEDCGVEE